MTDYSPPLKPYEPYPGCPMEDFESEFLASNPITLSRFCEKERIDPSRLPQMISDVLTDWELVGERHYDRQSAVRHLINHLRIKVRKERAGKPTQSAASGLRDIDRQMEERAERCETRKKESMSPRDYIRSLGFDPDVVTSVAAAMRMSREN